MTLDIRASGVVDPTTPRRLPRSSTSAVLGAALMHVGITLSFVYSLFLGPLGLASLAPAYVPHYAFLISVAAVIGGASLLQRATRIRRGLLTLLSLGACLAIGVVCAYGALSLDSSISYHGLKAIHAIWIPAIFVGLAPAIATIAVAQFSRLSITDNSVRRPRAIRPMLMMAIVMSSATVILVICVAVLLLLPAS